MTKKRWIILSIYALIIIGALIFILFFAPDKWFQKNNNQPIINGETSEPQKEKVDYETQKKNLTNNIYDYKYNLMYSMSDTTYFYECSGTINKDIETGQCTLPKLVEYNYNTKKEILKDINTDLLNPAYIFELVKDIQPDLLNNDSYTDYIYKFKFADFQTELVVRSGYESISEITLSNAYIQYHLKFTNIKG